ncbi:MAG: carbohydrate ABC transporter permease [Firmicutes bacterium]|nr:carbohydrate ABC transporter permease [Bacillota bacterium]
MHSRRSGLKCMTYIILILTAMVILFPMYITVVTSFKTGEETARSLLALPESLIFDNFQQVIAKSNFFTAVGNSFVITIISTIIIVLLNAIVAYFIVRNEHKRFYKYMFFYFIIGIFIPFQVLMLPLIKVAAYFRLMHIPGLTLLYVVFSLSTNVFLFAGFIKTIPRELEEAAYIDGCSKLGTLFRIVFPLLKTIMATVAVLTVLWIWNDFLLPLLILNRDMSYWTLPLFQFNFTTQYTSDYNLAFASYFMAMIPPIILYLFCQKYIIKGIADGAVKG